MSESTPETPVETPAPAPEAAPKTFTEDYVKELRAEAAKYRTEAKQLKGEIENVRKSSLTEAERAVVEAEQRGRMAVLSEMGKRLARTQFEAAAARRNTSYDVTSALEYVDLTRFVGEDGEPDSKAIAAAVERLVPAAGQEQTPVPSFDGGTRSGGSIPLNGDPLLNALKSKLGIPG